MHRDRNEQKKNLKQIHGNAPKTKRFATTLSTTILYSDSHHIATDSTTPSSSRPPTAFLHKNVSDGIINHF